MGSLRGVVLGRTRRSRPRSVWVVGACLVVATAVSVGTALAQQQHDVDVQDDDFAPETITVTAGDTVVWTQSGSNPHSVTADDESFDSHPDCGADCMGQGDTFTHTFDEEGEHPYYCRIHGAAGGVGMSGVVVVEAAQQDPDPQPTPDTQTTAAQAPEAAQEPEPALPVTGAVPALAFVLILGGLAATLVARRRR